MGVSIIADFLDLISIIRSALKNYNLDLVTSACKRKSLHGIEILPRRKVNEISVSEAFDLSQNKNRLLDRELDFCFHLDIEWKAPV